MAFYDTFGKYNTKKAIISEEGSVTYAELEDHAKKMRQILPSRSLIIQLCDNSIGSISGYLSFLYNRAVPLLLNHQMNEGFTDHFLSVYQPDFISIPSNMRDRFPQFTEVHHAFNYSLLKTPYRYKHTLYEELALLMSTSGSTGSPKLVRQSYKNIDSNAQSIAHYLALDENEKPLCFLPMHYTYGLSVIHSHLLVGATLVVTHRSLFEPEFWNLCKQQEVTSFAGVPYTYEMLKKLRFSRMNLPFLKTLTQAGGKLSIELHKEMGHYATEHQKKFFVMYGQTEATARMSYLPHDKVEEKIGSIGIAIPGGTFSLIDANDHLIEEPGKIGELTYEGPNVALGYAESAIDLAKGDEFHGKLKTGDMAKKDSDGYFYIVGRKKRFLKMFGNRVNLDETEQCLRHAFPYFDLACVGTDDCMKIFITSDSEDIKKEVKQFLLEKMGLHPSALHIHFIEKIPTNDVGKIQYRELGINELEKTI